MTRTKQIIDVLAEGPSTAEEVAIELGLPMPIVSAMLTDLKRRRKITASRYYKPEAVQGRNAVNLYALVHYQ